MNRRGFMQSILALSAAPVIVRAESLMPIVCRSPEIYIPSLGDLSGMLGRVRAFSAYDISTDSMLLRFDTVAGGELSHVTAKLAADLAKTIDRAALEEMVRLLDNDIKFRGYTHMDCVALPVPSGMRPFDLRKALA